MKSKEKKNCKKKKEKKYDPQYLEIEDRGRRLFLSPFVEHSGDFPSMGWEDEWHVLVFLVQVKERDI